MPADYATLATIYDTLGMSTFAENATPRLLEYAQRNEWMGRRILDMGCGTGSVLVWLARHGYIVEGVDSSAEMLKIAQTRIDSASVAATLRQGDIRRIDTLVTPDSFDMVLAINVLNELDNLRDLEATFKGVYQALSSGRLFIFSLQSLEGLAEGGRESDQVLYDDGAALSVITRSSYDYERQALSRNYMVFRRDGRSDAWTRNDAHVVMRGYPMQAVASLLQRTGMELVAGLTPDLNLYETGTSAHQIFFIAIKR